MVVKQFLVEKKIILLYLKNDNNWVIYNDSKLDFIDNPVTNNAYILFYKRKDLEENISNINSEDKNEKKLEKNININDNCEQ